MCIRDRLITDALLYGVSWRPLEGATSLVVPAIAIATGKTASLLDMWAQPCIISMAKLNMELYTYLWWPDNFTERK